MKIWIKILIAGLIIFAVIFGATSLYLVLKGKEIIVKQLEAVTGKKVSIEQVNLTLPFNLSITSLDIQGLFKVKHLSVSPNLLSVLSGTFIIESLNISGLEYTYEKTVAQQAGPVGLISFGIPEAPLAAGAPVKPGQKQQQQLRSVFRHLNIKDSTIYFIDRTIGKEGIKITVKDINLSISNLFLFPESVATNFKFSSKIPWQDGKEEGRVEAEGWLDLFKKDIQATLKVKDIDGVYLYPYYAEWVDLEKSRIESAKLNFTSDIKGTNNDVTADCHLELSDIVFKERPENEEISKAEKITALVLDVFKVLNKGKIEVNFKIKTKLMQPSFSFNEIKTAIEDKFAQARLNGQIATDDMLLFPVKVVAGTVKGATEVSGALLGGTFSLGKELARAVKYAFEREK